MTEPKIPASIRTNDPGAMWGKHNAIAQKWGAEQTIGLNDGLGQGNNIAVFPDKVHGAAAQFDLWNSHYTGITLAKAVTKWCGGNSPSAYVSDLCKATGLHSLDLITSELLAGPKGLALMKAQAAWEAGRPYPLSDAEWQQAQDMVFKGAHPPPDIPKPEPSPAPEQSFWSDFFAAIVSLFKRK